MSSPQFDPNIIERYAEQLYRKADSVRIGSVIAGAFLGVLFGAVPISPLGAYLPIPSTFGMATILLGALVGAFLGYAIGEGRAFRVRLQAQLMLFQLQLERNTAPAAAHPIAAQPVAPAPFQPVVRPAPIAAVVAPEPVIPVQPVQPAAVAPTRPLIPPAVEPPPPVAPPPLLAPRPPLETALRPVQASRQAEEPAPQLPPLSPSRSS